VSGGGNPNFLLRSASRSSPSSTPSNQYRIMVKTVS
jgi:hypothetical protein